MRVVSGRHERRLELGLCMSSEHSRLSDGIGSAGLLGAWFEIGYGRESGGNVCLRWKVWQEG